MPTRTVPDPPRYDATVQRNVSSVKNVYDRDPLLIPQLFANAVQPWYRRPAGMALIALTALCVVGAGAVVYRFGLGGAAVRVGRVAADLLSTFAQRFGG